MDRNDRSPGSQRMPRRPTLAIKSYRGEHMECAYYFEFCRLCPIAIASQCEAIQLAL
jgi:hypothetical protein